MPKGRHRKAQLTQLPAGARTMTGKAQSANKAKTYQRLLPVDVKADEVQSKGRVATTMTYKRGAAQSTSSQPYTFPAWADYLMCLCGYPTSSQEKLKKRKVDVVVGRWDPLSKSVYLDVTLPSTSRTHSGASGDEEGEEESSSMRYLWESGFFGKGTLSRSEPTWHKRQVNAIKVKRERERGGKVFTPEELTALRRKERKAAKIERARLAVRAGQQLADGIVALGGELNQEDEKAIERAAESELKREEEKDESAYGKHIPGLIYLKPQEKEQVVAGGSTAIKLPVLQREDEEDAEEEEEEYIDVADMERLQLSSYETLFLAGMIGVLLVVDEEDNVLSLEHLYALLMATVLPHSALPSSPFSTLSEQRLQSVQTQWARPDNPFLLQYIAYHHFRSLGWVVKSGVKFCVDFLLYKRGPAFSHAEFAVQVIPVYEDPDDETSSPFAKHPSGNDRSWVWFSSINRVNTQVLKTIILCHVTIPALSTLDPSLLSTPQGLVDGLQSGTLHHIREYAIRRFTPQRMKA
ncbi:hypothetical protein CBS101457_005690 [Exobasidium rhododendri]|nr:hypothetical protein CBS101457_005690 [Exobasidium rhododendri]